jgi:hypothetical protein
MKMMKTSGESVAKMQAPLAAYHFTIFPLLTLPSHPTGNCQNNLQ